MAEPLPGVGVSSVLIALLDFCLSNIIISGSLRLGKAAGPPETGVDGKDGHKFAGDGKADRSELGVWLPASSWPVPILVRQGMSGRRFTGGIGHTMVRQCVVATLLGVVTAATGVPHPRCIASDGVTQRTSSVHVTPL